MRLERGAPFVGAQLVDWPVAQNAGVVDDDVECAELVERAFHDGRAPFRRRDRVVTCDRSSARADNLLDDRIRAISERVAIGRGSDVVYQYRGTAPTELERVRATDAAPGTGHDRDPSVKPQLRHAGVSWHRSPAVGHNCRAWDSW